MFLISDNVFPFFPRFFLAHLGNGTFNLLHMTRSLSAWFCPTISLLYMATFYKQTINCIESDILKRKSFVFVLIARS